MNSPTSMAEALASPEASFTLQLLRSAEAFQTASAECPAGEWDPPEHAASSAPRPKLRLAVREPRADALLNYDELSALLNVPKGTLYNLVWQGTIPHVRLGPKTVRFEKPAIDIWLAKRRNGR